MSLDVKAKGLDMSGLDNLAAGLDRLEAYAVGPVIKTAAKAAAQTIVDRAIELVPVKSGRLKNAIKVRAGRSSKTSFSFLADAGARWFSGAQFYGAFQEFGWKSGSRKLAHRKENPGEHFMQHAAEEVAQEALDTFSARVLEGIKRELGNS